MSEPLSFNRVHLPRPLTGAQVEGLVARLAGSDVGRPLVFEIRADDHGIQHLVGSRVATEATLRNLVQSFVPGAVFESGTRTPVPVAGRIRARRTGLPIAALEPEALVHDLYEALDRRKRGETLVFQLILSRVHSPEVVRPGHPDPTQSVPGKLWTGTRASTADVRRRLSVHAAEARFAATLRIGVDATDPERRRSLVHGIYGALQRVQSAGVELRLARESGSHLNAAQPSARGLQLTARQLAPLVAWPLGDLEYPGVAGVHPRRLPAPGNVSTSESVFAVSTAPGPERPIGITAEARLSHLSVLAPTGAGKSEAVLAPIVLSDIRAGRPVVVVDPKGQQVDYLLDCLRPDEAERVTVIDPSDPLGTAGFNPLDARGRDPYAVADSIMATFKSVFAEGWGPRSEDILHAGTLTLAIDGQRRDAPHTLLDLPRLLTEPAFRRTVVPSTAQEPELARFWARFEELGAAQRDNELAPPMNKLRRYLMRRGVTSILGQTDSAFRLRDVWKTNRIVLVALNDALSGAETSQLIGGLVCSEVFMAAQERTAEKDPKRRPGFVYVDEMRKFLRLPIPLESALEISRSYGVGWALFGQGTYQLASELAQAIAINTRSRITFATSQREAKELVRDAPGLTADDIQALPKYEIYANVLTANGPSGWFSARTLPPPSRLGHGQQIRAACRDRRLQVTVKSQPAEAATMDSTVGHVRRRRA